MNTLTITAQTKSGKSFELKLSRSGSVSIEAEAFGVSGKALNINRKNPCIYCHGIAKELSSAFNMNVPSGVITVTLSAITMNAINAWYESTEVEMLIKSQGLKEENGMVQTANGYWVKKVDLAKANAAGFDGIETV